MERIDLLFKEFFALSDHIRYTAVYENDRLITKQRMGITDASSSESDKYEELLVNPTLIKLASQRGNIDCGGLHYFIIRYGSFFVLLIPCDKGHVNIGMESSQNPDSLVQPIIALLRKYNLK